MTDRELLEAAANAAGLTVGDWLPGMGVMRYDGTAGNYSKHRWNPLTEDGDALRLAVKLRMTVDCEDAPAEADRNAAVRRAIVLAASNMTPNV